MIKSLVATAAALALFGCSGSGTGNGAAPVDTGVPALPTDSWAHFRDGFIEDWFRLDPSSAVYEGRHDFDGRLPDWSTRGLQRQAAFLHDAVAKAGAFAAGQLNPQEAFERDYLVNVAQGKLFWLEDADQPHHNPAYYVGGGLDPNVYIARNYADAPTRMRATIAFLERVPGATRQIQANLHTPMPLSFVNYGVSAFNGFADFYVGDAKRAFASVHDGALQQRFDHAATAASQAMRGLAQWTEQQRGAATQDFAMGADRFSRMIATTEDVHVPLDQLEAAGRADLQRNQQALQQACASFAPGRTIPQCTARMTAHKAPGGPVAAARQMIPRLRGFVTEHEIVTVPGTEQALVEESPPYNRQNSAYIDPPGPFDHGVPSVYYISPPDPAWPQATQDAFVPGYGTLLFTSVHEVMPGHFVQFLHANRSPSLFGRLFVGYAYAEGWAHYTEQMMWDAGLNAGDAETHVGQLSEALLRNCRFLSAIGVHARGMTQEQSREMFVRQCYQDDGTAQQQAARATYDPAYLNYTMGKLMILKLRHDWMAAHPGPHALREFHDRFLSFGGPPIPLVRRAMMGAGDRGSLF